MKLKERHALLKDLLGHIVIEFKMTDSETFKPAFKNAHTTTQRRHYKVSVVNMNLKDRKPTFFTYFAPVTVLTSNGFMYRHDAEKYKQELVIGFLYCIMSDCTYLDSEGIKDALDLMVNQGCTPDEARTTYAALRENEAKIKKLFNAQDIESIQRIVEDY